MVGELVSDELVNQVVVMLGLGLVVGRGVAWGLTRGPLTDA